jgi:DNA-binding FrmR family transcriptional regulator
MKMQNPQTKSNLVNRLRRIEGQVRGVQRMLDEERQCEEIVQQMTSIRSAVHGAMVQFLQEQARDCLFSPPEGGVQAQEQAMKDLITMLGKIT